MMTFNEFHAKGEAEAKAMLARAPSGIGEGTKKIMESSFMIGWIAAWQALPMEVKMEFILAEVFKDAP